MGSSKSAKARLLIVDDHPLFRRGLVQFINDQNDLLCCGEADGRESTLKAVKARRPDLVVLDLRLRREDGLELIKSLKGQHPAVRILVLSQYDEMLYAERALRAGADGYVMKEEATEEVLLAIRTILDGEAFVSRKASVAVLKQLLPPKSPSERSELQSLTDREFQVFQMIGSGLTSRQVAERLHRSIKTVETHRENIKRKLALSNAADLVHRATAWMEGRGLGGPASIPPKGLV